MDFIILNVLLSGQIHRLPLAQLDRFCFGGYFVTCAFRSPSFCLSFSCVLYLCSPGPLCCLWLLYHFVEPFCSLNALFKESYLFSSTLLFIVLCYCFFFFFYSQCGNVTEGRLKYCWWVTWCFWNRNVRVCIICSYLLQLCMEHISLRVHVVIFPGQTRTSDEIRHSRQNPFYHSVFGCSFCT